MRRGVVALLAILLLGDGYVRLAPSDPAVWHVDPLTAPDPGRRGVLMTPATENSAPVYDETPNVLMGRLDAAIRATPRTGLLAGSVAEGFATYVVRSRVFGFPDYVSVRVLPSSRGGTFAIYSRARFGDGDLGVNRKRLERWLAVLSPASG